MSLLLFILMFRIIETVFTSAEKPTLKTIMIAFTVFFDTVGFLAFAASPDFLDLDAKTKTLDSFVFFLSFLFLKTPCVPSQCGNDSFFVFLSILLNVPTVVAFTILIAIELPLEALAIAFETLRAFAVAAEFFLLHIHHGLLLVHILGEDLPETSAFALLRERRRRVPDCVFHRETLFISFLEGLSEGLLIH